MEYRKIRYEGATASMAVFKGTSGIGEDAGRSEIHVVVRADTEGDFISRLRRVENALACIVREQEGMRPVFKRYFLSDPANQAGQLPQTHTCAVSVVGQPPLDGSKIALWAVLEQDADFHDEGNGLWRDSRGRIWLGDGILPGRDSRMAAEEALSRLSLRLEGYGASLLDNCVRTWFMVRDIDSDYAGVVAGRNEVFSRLGLTRDTHFISSTGIGGCPSDGGAVAFNAFCDTALLPGQMGFLHGASHLNPTIEYGVAFERGTTADYADRRHVYISGTASIDRYGEVVAPGDIGRQTDRMIENLRVLLAEAGCVGSDVAHLLVYLRDLSDFIAVDRIFRKEFPDVPRVVVLAPVCRPGWLVETECMAVKREVHPEYASF